MAGDAPCNAAERLTIADSSFTLTTRGGSHMSLRSDDSLIGDVVEHRQPWVSPLGGKLYTVFAFDDSDVRIDYQVWSPDGRWILFDRLKPAGGDIWLIEQSRPAK